MSVNVWIITTDVQVQGLLDAASGVSGRVDVVVVGDRSVADHLAQAAGVGRVLFLETPPSVPAEAAAASLAALAVRERPELVLAGSSGTDRVLLSAVATAAGCEVLTGVLRLRAGAAGVQVERTLYGGIVDETSEWQQVAVVAVKGAACVPLVPARTWSTSRSSRWASPGLTSRWPASGPPT